MKHVTYTSVRILFNGAGRLHLVIENVFDSKIGFPSKYPKLTDTNVGLFPYTDIF
jgi:hypothetical protein